MWCRVACVAALLAAVQGACDTNTLFFGDVNLSTLPPYQVTVVSAVGTYTQEANNVSLVAYRHIGRPDQFILQEPSEAPKKKWVVATLPDNKKPGQVAHAYEAWPEAGNILAWGEFDGEPWAAGAGAWEVRDCDEGRTPLPSLSLTCVAATFGQCSTDRWRIIDPSAPDFVDVMTPSSESNSHGRREFHSTTQKLSVGEDGRWRLSFKTASLPASLVSAAPAERLEYVRGWRALDAAGAETDTEKKVECEAYRDPTSSSEPCAAKPCKNNGTCIQAPGAESSYFCRCRFDSVSANCLQVRECNVPKDVANAELLFTTDLSPQGKAFYRCDVGYYVKNGTGSAGNKTTNRAFATCDGRNWQNLPICVPITTKVTIEASYVHHCNFDAGWCDGYQHEPSLSLSGRTQAWKRANEASDADSGRGWVAQARFDSSTDGRKLALLQTPCMFIPKEGCAALDIRLVGNVTLTVIDDDEVTLWRTSAETAWTTATLTLPPGRNRLSFEAVMEERFAHVSLDNVRVFQWNCKQTSRLLFPPPPKAKSSAAMAEVAMPLLSLVLLLAYSGMRGVLNA